MPRQQKAMKRPTLEMNVDDARHRGLEDGQPVLIRNAQGTLRAWVHVTEDIQAGAVALPGKWWGEATANVLTPSSWSPGGQPAYNDTFVEVSPTLLRSPTLSE